MAIHKVTIRENTSATKDKAPFLGKYQSNGSVESQKMIEDSAKEAKQTEIQTQAIIEGIFAASTKKNMTEGPTRMHLPGGASLCVDITGSLASADSELGAQNHIVQQLRLGSDFRNELVNEVPTILSDGTGTRISFDRVFDSEVKKPQSVIYGKRAARAQGVNIVTTDEGASVYLVNAKGIKFTCTVLEVVSSQEFTFKTDALLEGGDYWAVIETRGGNPDGNLQKVRKPVKYIKVESVPVVTKLSSPEYENEGKVSKTASAIYIDGSNFAGLTKDNFVFTVDGMTMDVPATATWSITDERVELINNVQMLDAVEGAPYKVTITKPGCDPVEFTTTIA